LLGKPFTLSISSTRSCSTRSKAFLKSSLRTTISLLEWWHWCKYSKAHPR
jgi:hypothetical protein